MPSGWGFPLCGLVLDGTCGEYGDAMIVTIIGPTASGKTALALELAEHAQELGYRGAEIVGADAFQLYRDLDIGTAKPTVAERARFPHHQVDVLEMHQVASVAAYQKYARADIAAIQQHGALPIVVGGSGLYVRALLDDLRFPGTDAQLRARIDAECERIGAEAAHARLAELDPKAAASIEPRNLRRIVRALEVIELTGEPFSANLPEYRYLQPTVQIGLRWPVDELSKRIEQRTKAMFEQGLVDEVVSLQQRGLAETPTASKATGYAQVLDYLGGESTLEQAHEAIALATRQLASRQRKWFRRDPRIHWIDPGEFNQLVPIVETALIESCERE